MKEILLGLFKKIWEWISGWVIDQVSGWLNIKPLENLDGGGSSTSMTGGKRIKKGGRKGKTSRTVISPTVSMPETKSEITEKPETAEGQVEWATCIHSNRAKVFAYPDLYQDAIGYAYKNETYAVGEHRSDEDGRWFAQVRLTDYPRFERELGWILIDDKRWKFEIKTRQGEA